MSCSQNEADTRRNRWSWNCCEQVERGEFSAEHQDFSLTRIEERCETSPVLGRKNRKTDIV